MSDVPPARSVTIRPRAIQDIERHVDYLEDKAGAETAQRFREAIITAIDQIAFMPGTGTPREVRNTQLSGLRMHSMSAFRNYLLFYLTPKGNIEIIRVFHGAQDISSILDDE